MMKTTALRHLLMAIAIGFGTMVASSAGAATVKLGDTVTCAGPAAFGRFVSCDPSSATIGNGVEFKFRFLGNDALALNFSEDLLTITGLAAKFGLSSGISLDFTNTTNPFVSATLISNDAFVSEADDPVEFSQSNITVTNGVLSIDLGQMGVSNTGSLKIALAAAPSGPGGGGSALEVPEPTTWALMMLGFGTLGTALRRRRLNGGQTRFA